jgi:hypothetical protein
MKTLYPRPLVPTADQKLALAKAFSRIGPSPLLTDPAPEVFVQPTSFLGSVRPLEEAGTAPGMEQTARQLGFLMAEAITAKIAALKSASATPTLRAAVYEMAARR